MVEWIDHYDVPIFNKRWIIKVSYRWYSIDWFLKWATAASVRRKLVFPWRCFPFGRRIGFHRRTRWETGLSDDRWNVTRGDIAFWHWINLRRQYAVYKRNRVCWTTNEVWYTSVPTGNLFVRVVRICTHDMLDFSRIFRNFFTNFNKFCKFFQNPNLAATKMSWSNT